MHPSLQPNALPMPEAGLNHRPGMAIQTHAASRMKDESSMDADRFGMGVVFLIAVVFQVILGLLGPLQDASLAVHTDTPVYEKLGMSVIQNKTFAWDTSPAVGLDADVHRVRRALDQLETGGSQVAETLRTPGYSVLLGLQSLTGAPAWCLIGLQMLLNAATAALAFFVATQLIPGSRFGSWTAGLCVALHPAAIASSGAFLPVTVCVFLLMASIAVAVNTQSKRSDAPLVGGICLGLASLMIPLNWFTLIAVSCLAFAKKPGPQGLRQAAVFGLCAAVIPLTWSYRNHHQNAGFTVSNAPAVHAYYEPALLSSSTESEFAAPDAHRQALTGSWFQATRGRENENAFSVMRELTAENTKDQGLGARLRHLSWRVFHGMTAENTAVALGQLGLSTQNLPAQRDLLSLGQRELETDASIQHLGTAWILINGMLMMMSFIGCAFLVLRGQTAMALSAGVLVLSVVLSRHGDQTDPYHYLLLCVQPLLIASALSTPINPDKRRKKKKKLAPVQTAPEFNVYGQPTRHFNDDNTQGNEELAPTPPPTAFAPPATSDQVVTEPVEALGAFSTPSTSTDASEPSEASNAELPISPPQAAFGATNTLKTASPTELAEPSSPKASEPSNTPPASRPI